MAAENRTQEVRQQNATADFFPTIKKLPGWFCYLVIALVTLAVWGKTIGYEFVWDDESFIVKNQSVYSLKNIPSMFLTKRAQSAEPEKSEIFRPLRTMQYAVLRALGGNPSPQPWIFHLANVLWHAAAAMLLFSVLQLLFQRLGNENVAARGIALLMALGFSVHPVVSEVVCWAKSLDDLMAAVFALAAARELLVKDFGRKNFVLALVYFLLAVYSKESAVPFALLTFFIFRLIHGFSWKKCCQMAAGFFVIAFLYVVHRRLVLGQSGQCPPISGGYGQTLIDMLPVAVKYSRLLLGIPPFHIDYSYLRGHNAFFSGEVLLGLLIVLVFIALTVWSWRQPRLKMISFGLLWFELFLLPVANVIPMMQYMAERFLYLPLMGILIAAGVLLLKCARPALAAVISGAFILFWIPTTWQRENIWRDELTLFVTSCVQGPVTPRMEKAAVIAIMKLPQMRALYPGYTDGNNQLVMTVTLTPEKAQPVIATLLDAHKLFPGDGTISTVLGATYSKIGQLDEARQFLELATQQNPNDPWCRFDLATVLDALGNTSAARNACESSLQLDPKNVRALQLEIKLCFQNGDLKTALEAAEKLHAIDPQNPDYSKQIETIKNKIANQR